LIEDLIFRRAMLIYVGILFFQLPLALAVKIGREKRL